jgi:UDP-glucuronate decarboxylase
MRILVTGGAGFLGSHLCEKLLLLGHKVLAVDNFYTGSQDNIDHLRHNANFEFIRHDVTFPLYVEVDGIFNLACPASPLHYQKNPVQTLKTSVHGAINLLGLAKRTGARFLQASTSEIYGDPTVSPQNEEYWGNVNPIGVRSCYDEGKRAAETLTFDYQRQFRIDARVARIFNTYGPRMAINDGRVVSNFIVQSLNSIPLTVYGDGRQIRSFCYVDDLIEGLVRLFFAEKIESPINLGRPEPISMLELATLVNEKCNSLAGISFEKLPQDDPSSRVPDIKLAREKLLWEPNTALNDGLGQTIKYFQKILNIAIKNDERSSS